MRKLLFAALLMVVAASTSYAASAAGSSFGTFTTASTLEMGRGSFTIGVGFADQNSFVGGFNYGLSRFTEGRIRLALVDVDGARDPITGKRDSEVKLAVAIDFKHQFMVMDKVSNSPMNMSFGGSIEMVDFGPVSIFQFGGQLFGSYPILLSNGKMLTPYGRFNIRLEKYSYEGSFPGDTDLEFGLNGGVAWGITKTVNLYGEFQLDGNDGIFLGVDFSVM